MKQYAALQTGGRMGILMGDIRRNGVYKSMLLDMAKPGDVDALIIKKQNNTWSGNKTYANRNFVPIDQEYFLILKKMSGYILDFSYVKRAELDARDSSCATWKDVVYAVLEHLGANKELSLDEIYREIEPHKKAVANPHWKDKVRQVLQLLPNAENVSPGRWVLAA